MRSARSMLNGSLEFVSLKLQSILHTINSSGSKDRNCAPNCRSSKRHEASGIKPALLTDYPFVRLGIFHEKKLELSQQQLEPALPRPPHSPIHSPAVIRQQSTTNSITASFFDPVEGKSSFSVGIDSDTSIHLFPHPLPQPVPNPPSLHSGTNAHTVRIFFFCSQ